METNPSVCTKQTVFTVSAGAHLALYGAVEGAPQGASSSSSQRSGSQPSFYGKDGAAHKPWLDGIPCLLRTLPLGRRQVGNGQRRSTHTHVKIVYPVFFPYCVTPLASRRGGHRLQEVAAGAGDEDEKDAVRPSPDGQGSLRSHGGLDTLLIGRSFLARSADQLGILTSADTPLSRLCGASNGWQCSHGVRRCHCVRPTRPCLHQQRR